MKTILKFTLAICLFGSNGQAQHKILNLKDRAAIENEILDHRFNTVLPSIMREEKIDMWVIISREYNEDPVMKTMLPSEWLSARRRSIFVFYDNGTTVERAAIARYDVGELLKGEWDLLTHPNQWDALKSFIEKKNPKKIAVDMSANYAHADGISKTEFDLMQKALPASLQSKVVSAERLAVKWLELRTNKELDIYEHIGAISHEIIKEAFSSKVIQPGVSTTDDVVWWLRQKVSDLGLDSWFHPTVDVQRADNTNFEHLRAFSKSPKPTVIQPGDLVHCDFGINYLRLNTDHQQLAYVLKAGETTLPAYLEAAMKEGNRLQEILVGEFKSGLTGNEILANALTRSKKEGINGTIYTHPIGYHGHAAGPTIGMWDNQGPTIGPGDYPLHANTLYSIELNAAVNIQQWNKTIRIMLEENGLFDGQNFRFIDGRQKELYLIK